MARTPQTDYVATNARRYSELVSARERALQQVDDLESEVLRLRQDRDRISRPDARLWWGVGVVVYFTIVGIALPTWVMSHGPKGLTPHIRLLFWFFASGLFSLIVYVVSYLVKLTSRAKAADTPRPTRSEGEVGDGPQR